jgi:hypothetical protein
LQLEGGHEKPVPQQWPEKVGLGFALPNASECGDELRIAMLPRLVEYES